MSFFIRPILQKATLSGVLLLTGATAFAQTTPIDTVGKKVDTTDFAKSMFRQLDELLIKSLRVTDENGVAYTTINKEELNKLNLGQDLPILLNFQPSVVTTTDAGAGVGYTGLRIRGSDATRINVTINGVPVNDAESQGVFWVNTPDLISSLNSIQIQRGVGASTNGAGAFGASINLQTDQHSEKAFAEINNSFGSFNTFKHTVKAGTGLINDKFVVEGRLSKITSDGFIDRASSDLKSFFLTGGYHGKKTMIKMNIFSGQERTYQAWYGVPESRLRGNRAEMEAYADRNGLDEQERQRLLQSNSRTYNPYWYNNEVDNYQQDYYQAFVTHQITNNWNFHAGLHYTKGRGYFEQYRKNDNLANYNLPPVILGGDTLLTSDLIRRRWLDNDFYGTVFSTNYNTEKLDLTIGGGWNRYEGKHFGEVIWARYASNSEIRHRYYDNDATKTDFNTFAKATYKLTAALSSTIDLQYRRVDYNFVGLAVDDNLGTRPTDQTANFNFFNPKLAISYYFNDRNQVYASWGVGNKEPNRNDFTESSVNSRPTHETLLDYEAGFRRTSRLINWQTNVYFMDYHNQLVLTGQVNDVGAFTRTNVARSYRAGIELEAALKISKKLTWRANATLSQNKILNYTEFTSVYDEDFNELPQLQEKFSRTNIAFSPNTIVGSQIEYHPIENFTLALLSKYVGRQYLDNTSNRNRQLDAYYTQDIRLSYLWKPKFGGEVNFNLLLNNVLNTQYESNGYTFGYIYAGERIQENFYYPQAGTNFLLGVNVRF